MKFLANVEDKMTTQKKKDFELLEENLGYRVKRKKKLERVKRFEDSDNTNINYRRQCFILKEKEQIELFRISKNLLLLDHKNLNFRLIVKKSHF